MIGFIGKLKIWYVQNEVGVTAWTKAGKKVDKDYRKGAETIRAFGLLEIGLTPKENRGVDTSNDLTFLFLETLCVIYRTTLMDVLKSSNLAYMCVYTYMYIFYICVCVF